MHVFLAMNKWVSEIGCMHGSKIWIFTKPGWIYESARDGIFKGSWRHITGANMSNLNSRVNRGGESISFWKCKEIQKFQNFVTPVYSCSLSFLTNQLWKQVCKICKMQKLCACNIFMGKSLRMNEDNSFMVTLSPFISLLQNHRVILQGDGTAFKNFHVQYIVPILGGILESKI